MWVQSLGSEDPLEKELVIDREVIECYSSWGCKELDTTERLK